VVQPLSEEDKGKDEAARDEARRAESLALIQAQHQFPTDWNVSIITVNEEAVCSETRAAVQDGLPQPLTEDQYETVLSRGGRYTSHRFKVPCREAEEVLALYDRIKRVKGVIQVF
jgi:putative lipoic acid-binding regulatory protein